MKSFVPFVLIFLAIFVAACIAYIAWEFSSDKRPGGAEPEQKDAGKPPASPDP